ncbi:MerR family transcriptional regulator [Nocardia asteroides]|nr:MerR family transcriptional regulator [Nocardia asteroides]
MRIGELSERTSVSQRLLRYYEEQGLLAPLREPSGYRSYRDSDIERVHRIRTLLAAGLSTATIAHVLPCILDTGDGLAAACPDLLADLHRERDRISAAIGELTSAQHALDSIIHATKR